MSTMDILTLLLVIFAALSYIDNHKREIASDRSLADAISYSNVLRTAIRLSI